MDELLDETIASIQMVSQTHRIIRDGHHSGQMICGDREKIEQVLINLLSNAVKYSAAENKVIVSSKYNGSVSTIKIRDYGIGIAEDELASSTFNVYRSVNTEKGSSDQGSPRATGAVAKGGKPAGKTNRQQGSDSTGPATIKAYPVGNGNGTDCSVGGKCYQSTLNLGNGTDTGTQDAARSSTVSDAEPATN